MQYLTNDDLNYLSAQNQDKMNMVVYGMTALMDETNDRVQQLESQTWFQRMSNTLTGKNKMTVNEIANNRDKINVYLSEAISCLYDQNKINENMILGLGNRLNELYAQQIEIKQMIGAFVTKLNQKIISIDNFHMLTEEINQGVYSADTPIVSICMIASRLDARTVHDSRKMGILLRAMEQNGLLSDEKVLFVDFLQELMKVSEADSGVIAMMFENAKDDYVIEIALETVCQYYMLPDKVRKMKNRKSVVESVLTANQIDLDCTISTKEYYESLIGCLTDNILLAEAQNEESENERKHEELLTYFDTVNKFFDFSTEMFKSWNFNKNELSLPRYKNNTSYWLKKINMFYSQDSAESIQYFQTLSFIDYFVQSIIKIDQYKTMFPANGLFENDGKYYTICDLVQDLLKCTVDMNFSNGKITVENTGNITDSVGFGMMGYLFDNLTLLFSSAKEKVDETTGNSKAIDQAHKLCNKYPIEFLQGDNSGLIKPAVRAPYISFTDNGDCSSDMEIDNETHVLFLSKNQVKVFIHFNNMDKLGTIHYSILENKCDSVSAELNFNSYYGKRQYNVKWGDWKGKNVCELIIDKIIYPAYTSGTLKIKVWADYDPDCVGIITA